MVQTPTNRFKANIGLCWLFSRSKVIIEYEIMIGISKGLKIYSVYNMFYITSPANKIFNQFFIFGSFRFSEIRDTGISIHI